MDQRDCNAEDSRLQQRVRQIGRREEHDQVVAVGSAGLVVKDLDERILGKKCRRQRERIAGDHHKHAAEESGTDDWIKEV